MNIVEAYVMAQIMKERTALEMRRADLITYIGEHVLEEMEPGYDTETPPCSSEERWADY